MGSCLAEGHQFQDWEAWLAKTVDVDLELRDKWRGIKFIRKNHEPKFYEQANRHKQLVDFDSQAEAAADHLEQCQWPPAKTSENIPRPAEDLNQAATRKANRPYRNDWDLSTSSRSELRAVIKKMQKNKASGPDETPIQFYEWLDEDNLELLFEYYQHMVAIG